jgi:hypothetical protein
VVKLVNLGPRDDGDRARIRNVSNNLRNKGTVFEEIRERGQKELSVWNTGKPQYGPVVHVGSLTSQHPVFF